MSRGTRILRTTISFAMLGVFGFLGSLSTGAVFVIDADDRGWYSELGFHEVDNPNYFVGDGRGFIGGSELADARNFFYWDENLFFDVPGPITSATLSVTNPFPFGFFTNDPQETYKLVQVTTHGFDVVDFTEDGLVIHEDLGTGIVYGTKTFGISDTVQQVEIPLSTQAIADFNTALETFNPFVIGGSIPTLNQFPDDEFLFAFSAETFYTSQLIVTTDAIDPDFNDDLVLNCEDVDALVLEISQASHIAAFDLNADSVVDQDDLADWLAQAGATNLGAAYLNGDANLDGAVDLSDLHHWNEHRGTATAAWCSGDFNADGSVDEMDFDIWNSEKFNSSASSAVVPEPQGLAWVALGIILLAWRRRG